MGATCQLASLIPHALPCAYRQCPIEQVADHLPLEDEDGDRYSLDFIGRGSAWRGKDCNDSNAAVHPGRDATSLNPSVDHNWYLRELS